MTYEEARNILLKQFDKSCGNYTFQNAQKIDFEEALIKGAEALEKQIPKKPIDKTKGDIKLMLCPYCGNNNILPLDKYCSDCGQALDWGDKK